MSGVSPVSHGGRGRRCAAAMRPRRGAWGRAGAWAATLLALAIVSACERKAPLADAFPATLTAESTCAVDGMLLMEQPGPKGQLLLSDGERLFYCDVRELFEALHDADLSHRILAAYAQPMDGRPWGSHADGWADARELTYVMGSERWGAMGPTLVPFRSVAAAHRFRDTHGGAVRPAPELTAQVMRAYAREAHEAMRKRMAPDPHAGTGRQSHN